jgi:hypothetical protein
MAPVPMVEIEHDNVSQGLDYFCSMFDSLGYSLPLLHLSALYHNWLTDAERVNIINDINHHVGQVQLLHLYGLWNIDTLVT